MYTMTPFEKKHFDLLNAFHDFENDFFAGTGWSTCKVDVRDEGNKPSCQDLKKKTFTLMCKAIA